MASSWDRSKRKHVYLVRHGESSRNADSNRFSGIEDAPLTVRGREQCRALAKFFRKCVVETVYSSRLVRSLETALLAFPDGPRAEVREELLEFDYGQFDGIAIEELPRDHPVATQWREAPGDMTFPGGQNIRAYADSTHLAMCRLIRHAPVARIACIGHKTMGRLFVAKVIGLDLNAFRGIPVDNCSVTEFVWSEGAGFVLRTLNLVPEELL